MSTTNDKLRLRGNWMAQRFFAWKGRVYSRPPGRAILVAVDFLVDLRAIYASIACPHALAVDSFSFEVSFECIRFELM